MSKNGNRLMIKTFLGQPVENYRSAINFKRATLLLKTYLLINRFISNADLLFFNQEGVTLRKERTV